MHIKTLFATSTIDIFTTQCLWREIKYENANNINKWQKNVFFSIQFNITYKLASMEEGCINSIFEKSKTVLGIQSENYIFLAILRTYLYPSGSSKSSLITKSNVVIDFISLMV